MHVTLVPILTTTDLPTTDHSTERPQDPPTTTPTDGLELRLQHRPNPTPPTNPNNNRIRHKTDRPQDVPIDGQTHIQTPTQLILHTHSIS